jgi:hypothetical protein
MEKSPSLIKKLFNEEINVKRSKTELKALFEEF